MRSAASLPIPRDAPVISATFPDRAMVVLEGMGARVYAMQTVEVTFYTRRDCRLCDEAKRAIRSARLPIDLHEIDVDDDPNLSARFGEDVPVIYVAGREAFRHRVKRNEFEAYIRGAAIMSTLANEKCIPCRGGVPPL